jgi:hypothetical protein
MLARPDPEDLVHEALPHLLYPAEDAASLGLSVEMAASSVGEGHPTATLW